MTFDVKNDMYIPLGRSVPNFRPLKCTGSVKSYNGIVRELVRDILCVAYSCFATKNRNSNIHLLILNIG